MVKHLYKTFADRWYLGGGNIWFYSDPHFGDKEMANFRKNYITDDEQIKRINSKLTHRDTLIILGDVGDASYVEKIKAYRKILIKGNHDSGNETYNQRKEYRFENGRKARSAKCRHIIDGYGCDVGSGIWGWKGYDIFDEIYEGCLMISPKIILSHEPIDFPYAFNIHGHVHKDIENDDRHFNCCAEHINYTPVCLKHIVESGCLKNVLDIHRETIDKAIENKRNEESE